MKSLNQLASEGIKYAVVKVDNTQYWHDDIKVKAKKIWTVSLVDLTQPTNLCEISVSYPFEELRHFFEDITEGVNMDDIYEHEYAELSSGYFSGGGVFNVVKMYDDKEMDFDQCFEYENGNPSVC